ncbi:class I SAM-dependent methyltransferase [Quadrisphaera sp. INWT6]|uniref:class I SAM-dependent methyltransferase n=1 Tax=Quadrisphaera sp. INWT6 TaxID=2596917 RepID=UPI001892172F|nr:class I SAM-dependent methyltransferase [Quadrisphaera sp. INWT6]
MAPSSRTSRPVGRPTRGTTGTNRLRRIDRWATGPAGGLLRSADDPLVVDLGYGASATTTVELASRLRAVRPDVEVVGLEIDPGRVALARAALERLPAGAAAGVRFELGGFELGAPAVLAGRRPVLVRAANVLRQYPVEEVAGAWALVAGRLAPGGLLVDATCDEVGRRAAWLVVGGDGAPRSLVLSLRLAGLERPGAVAERLPKALIERNVPGEPVHAYLAALDAAWARQAPLAVFGARQRFAAACAEVAAQGWPVRGRPARWRLGEVAVDAGAVGL